MNDTLSVTVYVILDDLLRAMEHRTDPCARTSDSEVLTVGVIAACQFANHHERPLCILHALAGALWAAFGWRLHFGGHDARGSGFLMPLPLRPLYEPTGRRYHRRGGVLAIETVIRRPACACQNRSQQRWNQPKSCPSTLRKTVITFRPRSMRRLC